MIKNILKKTSLISIISILSNFFSNASDFQDVNEIAKIKGKVSFKNNWKVVYDLPKSYKLTLSSGQQLSLSLNFEEKNIFEVNELSFNDTVIKCDFEEEDTFPDISGKVLFATIKGYTFNILFHETSNEKIHRKLNEITLGDFTNFKKEKEEKRHNTGIFFFFSDFVETYAPFDQSVKFSSVKKTLIHPNNTNKDHEDNSINISYSFKMIKKTSKDLRNEMQQHLNIWQENNQRLLNITTEESNAWNARWENVVHKSNNLLDNMRKMNIENKFKEKERYKIIEELDQETLNINNFKKVSIIQPKNFEYEKSKINYNNDVLEFLFKLNALFLVSENLFNHVKFEVSPFILKINFNNLLKIDSLPVKFSKAYQNKREEMEKLLTKCPLTQLIEKEDMIEALGMIKNGLIIVFEETKETNLLKFTKFIQRVKEITPEELYNYLSSHNIILSDFINAILSLEEILKDNEKLEELWGNEK